MSYNRKSSQIKQAAILALLVLIWGVLYFLPIGNNGYSESENQSGNVTDNGDVFDTSGNTDQGDNEVTNLMAGMTIEQKVAQMFIITPEQLTGVKQVTAAGSMTQAALSQYPVGGLVYSKGNIVTPEQIITLISNTKAYAKQISGLSLFACIDEQGGTASQFADNGSFTTDLPGEYSTVTTREEAYELGSSIGEYLLTYGFNVDFAPVANSSSDDSDIQTFGDDYQVISEMASGMAEGLSDKNILATMKYFPGIEGTTLNSMTSDQLLSGDVLPFATGIEQGVPLIMVGNITLPQIIGDNTPASLSKEIVSDLLIGEMGYKGIVVSDALNSSVITETYDSAQAAIKAIQAGNDMLLTPEDFAVAYQGVLGAIESGDITVEQIDGSVSKIIKAKLQLGS